MFHSPPQPLERYNAKRAIPERLSVYGSVSLQARNEVGRRELAPLIRVEDLWHPATSEYHINQIETELRVKAVEELLAEHVS